MKIYITAAGKIFLLIIAIGFCIFLAYGGWAVVSKMIENYRVNSIDGSLGFNFAKSDISYDDMDSLRKHFRSRYEQIAGITNKIKQLIGVYPENKDLQQKLTTNEQYLQSMCKASFDCPEHIDTEPERRDRPCSKCGGDGWRWRVFKCRLCGGEGSISDSVSKGCPNCNTIHKSKITGELLLNER